MTPWRLLSTVPLFRRYLAASTVSNLGTWAQAIVLSVVIYDATGSVASVALINFARFFGSLFLPPLSGRIADRHDRAALLALSQLAAGGFALLLFVDYATTGSSFPRMFVYAVGIGLCDSIAAPVMHALIPSLVRPDQLPVALALNASSFNAARATGPVLGAAIVAVGGAAGVFGLNVVSFLGLATVAWRMRGAYRPAAPAPDASKRWLRPVLARPHVLVMLATVAALSTAMEPINTLTPAVAVHGLGRGAAFAGVLVSSFGLGAVVAVFTLGRVRRSHRALGTSMLVVLAGFAPMWLGLGLVPVLVGLVTAGGAFITASSFATATIHASIPDELRGRTMGLWTICFLGSRPLASLATGGLGEVAGYKLAGAVMGTPLALLAARLLVRRPGPGAEPPARQSRGSKASRARAERSQRSKVASSSVGVNPSGDSATPNESAL